MDAHSVPLHRLTSRALPQADPLPPRAPVLLPALLILAGALLRLSLLGLDVRFHPDEALFAAQARLASQGDLLLRGTDLDKPPLTIWITALSFRRLGPTEFAARLPNALFSLLSLALLYRVARALYPDRAVALLALLLWACSPFDLAFAATVFTDVQATFWVLAALLCALHDRWIPAGVCAALVLAAKPTGLTFAPLVAALGLARCARGTWRAPDVLHRLGHFILPIALGIGLLVLADLARAPRSFLRLGWSRNNPGRVIRSGELGPRLERWAHWLADATEFRLLNLGLLVIAPLGLARGLRSRSRAALADGLIGGFALAFLGVHWLIAFNTYDRYLHTLIPFVLLLAARLLVGLWRGVGARRGLGIVLLAVLLAGMARPVRDVLRGEAALGGDQGQHRGIDRLAQVLNYQFARQIVYDHWLGWELAYYLGSTPTVTIAYTPLPEALAADAAAQPQARYFVAPTPQQAAPWLDALRRERVQVTVAYQQTARGFTVYRLQPPGAE